jgi:hypothetical protein
MIGSGAAVVRRRCSPQVFAALLAVSGFLALNASFGANWVQANPVQANWVQANLVQANLVVPSVSLLPVDNTNTANDPLKSPYPIPWNAIWDHQTQSTQNNRSKTLRYLSPPLRSPDGQVAAHSEIEIKIDPDFRQSHIYSQLILKTAQGQVLQTIPSSMHLGQGRVKETTARHLPGTIAMLVPAAWSQNGQRLLARQFEAVFGSDVSSDYAVIWEREHLKAETVTPLPINYDFATLLGWSQNHPNQVLFRTDILGETKGSILAVDYRGATIASQNDQAVVQYGQAPSVSGKAQARR